MAKSKLDQGIRFGVCGGGLRASTWGCWPGEDQSFYLVCRDFKLPLHASFHPSGDWHVAFDRDPFFTGLFREGDRPSSRFSGAWKAPAPIYAGWSIAAQIYTPRDAVIFKVQGELSAKIRQVPVPPCGVSHEFRIWCGPKAGKDHPMLNDSPGNNRIGHFEMNEAAVVVMSRRVERLHVRLPNKVEPRYFAKGTPTAPIRDELVSMVAWDSPEDGGTLRFFEEAVRISGPAPE